MRISISIVSSISSVLALVVVFSSSTHLLGEVHALRLGRAPPPAEALVQVEHRHVREVRHARDRLDAPEPRERESASGIVSISFVGVGIIRRKRRQ